MTAFPFAGRCGPGSGWSRPKWQPRGSIQVGEADGVGFGRRGALDGAPGAVEGGGGPEREVEACFSDERHLADLPIHSLWHLLTAVEQSNEKISSCNKDQVKAENQIFQMTIILVYVAQ